MIKREGDSCYINGSENEVFQVDYIHIKLNSHHPPLPQEK